MPFAVALLCHPAGAFAALIAATVATHYAVQSRRFLPSFTAISAASLTVLSFLQVPPNAAGFAWLYAGVALLHAEFAWSACGIPGLLGVGTAAWGSWLLLAALEPAPRAAIALCGAFALLAAVARTARLRTLPP